MATRTSAWVIFWPLRTSGGAFPGVSFRDHSVVGIRVDPIRIHLGPMPQMLRAILGDLLGREPDIVIAGNSVEPENCLLEARRSGARIIVALDNVHDGRTCLELILAGPPIGVVAVSPDGHSAAGVSLARRPVTMGAGGPSALPNSIREMAAELGAKSMVNVTGEASRGSGPARHVTAPRPIQDPPANGGELP